MMRFKAVLIAVATALATQAAATAPADPFDLPLPPEAPVTIGAMDRLTSVLAARLVDPAALHPRLPKKEAEALAAFYAIGGFQPLWIEDGAWTPGAKAVIGRLLAARSDALDPDEYAVPPLAAAARDNPTALAEAELKLSAAAVLYARDARGGRLEPSRLSKLITPKLDLPSADAVLTRLAAAADKNAALSAYNPPHAGYRALRRQLAELRGKRSRGDPRLEGDIVANMERWRWLPADLGERHVMVDIPQFRVRVVEGGRPIHAARVIVGKPETPTPIFSDTMQYAVVNPSWTIPPSIMRKEILPGLARDPYYAARRGYQIVRTATGISVRQPPGERNALGAVKFMFPNVHAVYLHDTPNRRLFGAEKRAFSHGCVRVDQPFRLGEILLQADGWSEERLRGLVGRGERTVRMSKHVPVHLVYFTVVADGRGGVATAPDLYGIDAKVRAALGIDAAAVAEDRAARPGTISPRSRPSQGPGRSGAAAG
jgi:L,D-transpeptidase YcbB